MGGCVSHRVAVNRQHPPVSRTLSAGSDAAPYTDAVATPDDDITVLGIVGGGTMGAEIAQLAAEHGLQVLLADADADRSATARDRAISIGERRVARGRITKDTQAAAALRITAVSGITDLRDVDAVVEAVPEVLDVKIAVHAEIDRVVPAGALVATNTSGLSVTALADATRNPSRLVGLHFFNPASAMRLVEIIAGSSTTPDVVSRAEALARLLGKTPVRVRECPGFVVNRVLVRAMAETYRATTGAPADRLAVDAAVVAGGPSPMGPFALGDLVGLDVLESIRVDLQRAYGDRFADGGMLAPLVAEGRLGNKTGSGLVPQAGGGVTGSESVVAAVYYAAALDEARRLADEEIASPSDIDLAIRLGAGWASGPLTAA